MTADATGGVVINNRGDSPLLVDSTAVSSATIDFENWDNTTTHNDHHSTLTERGTAQLSEASEHHLPVSTGSSVVLQIHSPGVNSLVNNRLNRRPLPSRNKNSTCTLPNKVTRGLHKKSKMTKSIHEVTYLDQSRSVCTPKSTESGLTEEGLHDFNSYVRRSDRFAESAYIKLDRIATPKVAPLSESPTGKHAVENDRLMVRKLVRSEDKAKRNNTASLDQSQIRKVGHSKELPLMSALQGTKYIEDRSRTTTINLVDDAKADIFDKKMNIHQRVPSYVDDNKCDTEQYKSHEGGDCYPLDLTIPVGSLTDVSLVEPLAGAHDTLGMCDRKKPDVTGRSCVGETSLGGQTHPDAPIDPTKICWTKVEKDTLLKVVERLSISCLAEDMAIPISPQAGAGNIDVTDVYGKPPLLKTATLLSGVLTMTPPQCRKRTSSSDNSDSDPDRACAKSVKLYSDSVDFDSRDEYVTSVPDDDGNTNAVRNNDVTSRSPCIKNFTNKSTAQASFKADAQSVRVSRKRVHFNGLQSRTPSNQPSGSSNKVRCQIFSQRIVSLLPYDIISTNR